MEARCRRAVEVLENGTRVRTVEASGRPSRRRWSGPSGTLQGEGPAGDTESIFDTLTHAKDCVDALLGNALTTREQFDDRFDVQWIRQRADQGLLSRKDVAGLCVYLAEQVGRMQAPADDAEVQPWVEAVRREAEEGRATLWRTSPRSFSSSGTPCSTFAGSTEASARGTRREKKGEGLS